MSKAAMEEILAADLQMSEDMGVPRQLYENSLEVISWFGRFTVIINGRNFMMAVTPSTLFINEEDAAAPVAHLTGSEWLETPIGQIFHADFLASRINGTFQIFRRRDSLPFDGFEAIHHTHLLVYTDGSGNKEFLPVTPDFSSEAQNSTQANGGSY